MRDTTLLAFQKVAETKSLTAAARELYISTPSLKQSMDNLEKEVGFPVLNRTHKGVALTKEGQMLYEGSKRILADYNELLRKCEKSYRDTRNILRIGVPMPSVLTNICNDFSDAFPDIKLQFLTLEGKRPKEMLQMLQNETIDLLEFLNMYFPFEAGICFQPVINDHLCALVSYHNPLAKEDVIDLEKISRQTLYISDADSHSISILNNFIRESNPSLSLKTTIYTDTEIMNSCTSTSFYLSESFYAQKFVTLRMVPLKQKIIFDVGIAYKNNCSALAHKFMDFSKSYASIRS